MKTFEEAMKVFIYDNYNLSHQQLDEIAKKLYDKYDSLVMEIKTCESTNILLGEILKNFLDNIHSPADIVLYLPKIKDVILGAMIYGVILGIEMERAPEGKLNAV